MGGVEVAYHFESLDFLANQRKFNAFLADFEAGRSDKVKFHQHTGVEFLHLLRGKMEHDWFRHLQLGGGRLDLFRLHRKARVSTGFVAVDNRCSRHRGVAGRGLLPVRLHQDLRTSCANMRHRPKKLRPSWSSGINSRC